jgi:DNA-binding SARP family transcriptional activator/streptogramin lyase
MEFRVLGPLEVTRGSRRIELGAAKQRALLALLLVERGRVVPSDRLVEELWGGRAPDTARKSVQKYVSQLREVLGTDRIQTFERGYSIQLAECELDLESFERLRLSAQVPDPRRRAATLREALALVRGEPLADLHGEPWVAQVAEGIADLVLTVQEECHEAELMLGEHNRLVTELDELTRAHPFRERTLEHHMLALYRSGRQADALAVYRTAARRMRDELGLNPGTELRLLERKILAQDPSLAAPPGPKRKLPSPSSRRRLAVAAALTAAVAATAIAWSATTNSRASLRLLKPSIVLLDTRTGKVIRSWPYSIYRYPWATTGNGKFWLQSFTNGVTEIDPHTGAILRRVLPPFGNGTNLAVPRGKTIWYTGTGGLARFDLATNRVTAVYRPFKGRHEVGLYGIARASGSLWTASVEQNLVLRIDPRTGKVLARIRVPKPWWVASGDGELWVSSDSIGVLRIDPGKNRVESVTRLPYPSVVDALVVGDGDAWVTNGRSGTVTRIDPSGQVVRLYRTGAGAHEPSFSAGALWVTNQDAGTLVRIDSRTGAKKTFRFGHTVGTEASLGRYVMVAITPHALPSS